MKKFAIHQIAERHFQASGPGTLVANQWVFWAALEAAELPNPSVGGTEGQAMVEVPTDCLSGTFAPLAEVDPGDIRATIHRGAVECFVPRDKYSAAPVASARAVVYTAQAVKDDPDWDGTEPDGDYIVVAVLAQVSPDGSDPVSPHRFAHNLAGGNRRYLAEEYDLDQARAEAARVKEFAETYIKLG